MATGSSEGWIVLVLLGGKIALSIVHKVGSVAFHSGTTVYFDCSKTRIRISVCKQRNDGCSDISPVSNSPYDKTPDVN